MNFVADPASRIPSVRRTRAPGRRASIPATNRAARHAPGLPPRTPHGRRITFKTRPAPTQRWRRRVLGAAGDRTRGCRRCCTGAGRRPGRARCLRRHRRAPADQRPRHLHHHQRLDDAARSAGRHRRGQPPLRPSRRTGRGDRRPPGHPDPGRVGPGHVGLFGRADPRDRRLRRRRQSRAPRPHPEPAGIRQGRGDHPGALAQRLRRRDPRRRCARRHGRDRRRARGGDWAAHRADLRAGQPRRRQERAERQGDGADRQGQERPDPGRRRRRDPHHPQRPPGQRRDPGRLQRRQVPARAADGGPAARPQGSGQGRLGPQRAAPRPASRLQGRQGRSDWHAGRGRDLGEARPRRGVETLDRLARSRSRRK